MTRRVLIAVEGPHDEAFVARVLSTSHGLQRQKYLNMIDAYWEKTIPRQFPANRDGDLLQRVFVPSFHSGGDTVVAILNAGGASLIARNAVDTLSMLPSPPDAVGIVLDADSRDAPAKRFAAIREELARADLLVSAPGEVAMGLPRCGVFVMPDNVNPGTLEVLLLECAEVSYPTALARARDFVATVDDMLYTDDDLKELHKPAGRQKATVASVSAILKPGKAVQNTISDNRWVTAETLLLPGLRAFSQFLADLLGV